MSDNLTASRPVTEPPASARHGNPIGPRTIAALVAGLVILLLAVAASVWLAERNREMLLQTAATDRARQATSNLLMAATDAETGQRGFLITGREDYLAPYAAAAAALPRDIAQLRDALPADDAELQKLFPPLEAAVQAKFDELGRTIDLVRAGQRDAALALVQTDVGKLDMDRIRALAAAMQGRQRAEMQRLLGSISTGGGLLVAVDVAGLLLILILAGAVIVATNRNIAIVRAAEDELTRANARLERGRDTLEERVAMRTAELTEANVEIQRFAYIVSHDLRAPLVNILGFTSELESAANRIRGHVTDLASRSPDNVPPTVLEAAREDLPEAIGFIRTSAQKMDRLIGAILRLSREGRRVMAPEPIAMRLLLEEIAASLAHQATTRDATITIEDVPDLVADRLMMEQVFTNLMENALKYLAPGRPGTVRIRGQFMGETLLFEVIDNGRGVAARDLDRIFELFRRAGDQNVVGEGIGLAHVRALLRRMEGKIDCESTLDVGSTFRVQLPRRVAATREVAV